MALWFRTARGWSRWSHYYPFIKLLTCSSQGLDVSKVSVPVVGGHAGATIIPLLSQTQPAVEFTKEEIEALTPRIQVLIGWIKKPISTPNDYQRITPNRNKA